MEKLSKLLTYVVYLTVLGSLSQEIVYYHLYCNRKCYFSSSDAYCQKQPPEVFYQKGVLTNFSEFTGKHLYQNLFFKRLYSRFFPVNFLKFVGILFLQSTFRRLLLYLEPCQVSMIEVFCGNSKSLTLFAKTKNIIHVYDGSNHALLAAPFSYILHDDTTTVLHKCS